MTTASLASPIPCPAAVRDRLAVAVLCLAPRQRACLDWVARAGRPVRSIEVADGLHSDGAHVHFALANLWNRRLLVRTGADRSARYPRYWPADEVADVLARVPSLGRRRSKLDVDLGLAVLGAARDLIENGEWPSRIQVGEAMGANSGAVSNWVARLAAAGLLPGIERLSPRDRQRSMQRAPAVAREKGEAKAVGCRRLAWDARGGGRVYRVDPSVVGIGGGVER